MELFCISGDVNFSFLLESVVVIFCLGLENWNVLKEIGGADTKNAEH